MKLIVLGGPGAGKGTQVIKLCNYFKIRHVSTGDIFRDNISKNTELGVLANSYISRGSLVPDAITCDMVIDRISKDDCNNGYALDGFPRTLEQARIFQEYLESNNDKIDIIIEIDVNEGIIIDRVCGRKTCLECGATYHIEYNRPKKEGICDICGIELIQRQDDEVNTIKSRLEAFRRQTRPMIDYYKQTQKVISVDGNGTADEVGNRILSSLGVV